MKKYGYNNFDLNKTLIKPNYVVNNEEQTIKNIIHNLESLKLNIDPEVINEGKSNFLKGISLLKNPNEIKIMNQLHMMGYNDFEKCLYATLMQL